MTAAPGLCKIAAVLFDGVTVLEVDGSVGKGVARGTQTSVAAGNFNT